MIRHPASLESGGSQSSGSAGQATPVRTPPIDEAECEAWYDGEDAIEALVRLPAANDPGGEHGLALDRKTFDLGGARRCAIHIPGRGLSARHCELERRGRRLLLRDLDSTNGTILDGRRIRDAADLYPGDRFTAVPVSFIALNRLMRAHRPLLVELLGTGFEPSADTLMVEAAKGLGHILLWGESGGDYDRLAYAIHAMSLNRDRDRVPQRIEQIPADRSAQVALIKSAARSTLVLSVSDKSPPIDPTFSSMLFSPSYHVRVIVIAPAPQTARRLLPADDVAKMMHVWIRPLSVRAGELPVLLDRLLTVLDAPIRFSDLTKANQDRVVRHDWKRNWEDLRTAADRLTAIARVPNWETLDWRGRATATGIARTTLNDWYQALKFTAPLFSKPGL